MNVILIGFRGSGKSTVGRALAMRLGLEFVDTDEEVERRSGKTIARIFEKEGEAAFRKLEKEEVLRACRGDGSVIAVGGGAVENPELASEMRETGLVVLLSAPAGVLYERIERDSTSGSRRPPLTQSGGLEEVRELLARRHDAYHDTAHLEFDTSAVEPGAVADGIAAEYRKSGGEGAGRP
jgi:shikimate kinase